RAPRTLSGDPRSAVVRFGVWVVDPHGAPRDGTPIDGVREWLADSDVVHWRLVDLEPQRVERGPVPGGGPHTRVGAEFVSEGDGAGRRKDRIDVARLQRGGIGIRISARNERHLIDPSLLSPILRVPD